MIKPITGTLKRRIIIDISVGFGLGGAMASAWWWGFHQPMVAKRDAWYIENDKAKSA
ncbi:cytochrome c oxidase subunit 7A [Nadsonia fulvescens var. elongata DSM 6958]|uniref:Cytochrome c oxidase subunit 9, mitochondrial n=1 Tax=Nadsonia fulvescens var. elongata DSM 6958 TaxID=857566 RepID=A0A1E3PST2_9ASCO|nr:cytochrome c oxidase subunit 7A [Nadsonia fulvescens var. elongata DSM 6958]